MKFDPNTSLTGLTKPESITERHLREAREALAQHDRERAELVAEVAALEALLKRQDDRLIPPDLPDGWSRDLRLGNERAKTCLINVFPRYADSTTCPAWGASSEVVMAKTKTADEIIGQLSGLVEQARRGNAGLIVISLPMVAIIKRLEQPPK